MECDLPDEWVTFIIQTIAVRTQSKRWASTLDKDGDVRRKRPNHRANFPRLVPRITKLHQLTQLLAFSKERTEIYALKWIFDV